MTNQPGLMGMIGRFGLTTAGKSPDAPVLSLKTAYDRGASTSDGITNATNPGFNIDLDDPQVGDSLKLKDSGVQVGDTVVLTANQIAGSEDVDFNNTFSDDDYVFTVTHTNGGSESDPSNAVSVTVNTSLGPITGEVSGGGDTSFFAIISWDYDISSSSLVAGDIIHTRRDDGLLIATHTLTAGEVSAGTATEVGTIELEDGDTVIHYGYGDGTGSAAGTLSEADSQTLTITGLDGAIVLEDGASALLLEDEASALLLET